MASQAPRARSLAKRAVRLIAPSPAVVIVGLAVDAAYLAVRVPLGVHCIVVLAVHVLVALRRHRNHRTPS
jgi:hypothetical protein